MRKKILLILSSIIVLSGVGLIVSTLYVHTTYVNKMDNLLESHVVYNASSSDVTTEPEATTSNDLMTSIEVVEEDQKIKEIKKGTPIVEIPSLNIKVPVVNGTSSESLRVGAGKFENSVDMGDVGNFCIAGHSSTIYNCIFNNLESIKLLDAINCYNEEGKLFTYYVVDTFKTVPENYGVTLSTSEKTMTIVTCTENGTMRFIVSAKLMSDDELHDYKVSLQQSLVADAKNIANSMSDIDILSFIRKRDDISKIPYIVKFIGVEDTKPFFTNYIVSKDKLKVNKHSLDVNFNQSIGFNLNEILMEVKKI